MIHRFPVPGARTRPASGRFLYLVLLGLVLLGAACQTVGGPAADGPGAGPDAVVVQPGPISEADAEEAARLLESARTSFEARL